MTSHATLGAKALAIYPSCTCPRPACCRFCLESEGVEDFCPVALQLVFRRAKSLSSSPPPATPDGILRPHGGRRDGPDARRVWGPLSNYFPTQSKEREAGRTLSRGSGHLGEDPEDHGAVDGLESSTRVPTAGPSLNGSVPDVLPDEPTGHLTYDDFPHQCVEERHGVEQSQEAPDSDTPAADMPKPSWTEC